MYCARGECVVACDRVRMSSWKESNQGLLIAGVISHILCQNKRNRFEQAHKKRKKKNNNSLSVSHTSVTSRYCTMYSDRLLYNVLQYARTAQSRADRRTYAKPEGCPA
jgi:hypothetical protein